MVLLRYAWKARLLRVHVTPEVMRWGSIMSLSPVVAFAVSIPVAFASSIVAVLIWLFPIPFGIYMQRHAPEGAEVLE
ncbi:hypothetical protein [Catellatospora sp. NPDC049609]|uniref:hypothetical protein n=1 Tax=Catellatospora sp. NPDC049609 TaxID=3155505 RepID=UPI00343B49AD